MRRSAPVWSHRRLCMYICIIKCLHDVCPSAFNSSSIQLATYVHELTGYIAMWSRA